MPEKLHMRMLHMVGPSVRTCPSIRVTTRSWTKYYQVQTRSPSELYNITSISA